jgi:hypothetical protein
MQIIRTSRDLAEEFLVQRTLAVIGVSRTQKDFSRKLVSRLRQSGRTVYAVNPRVEELDGERCYPKITEVPEFVDGALLMVPDAALGAAIAECAAAGVPRVWIYGTGHPRKLDKEFRGLCHKLHISLINGLCPLMFLRETAWPHHLHGWMAMRHREYRAPV